MLFCRGEPISASILGDALSTFSNFSGLQPNPRKSSLFLAAISEQDKEAIKLVFPFSEGELPMRYLGVPLITSRLKAQDCKQLVDRITARVQSWTSRFLSFAGRLQLISSVLSSMHMFWATHFILPKAVARDIEQVIRRFLWKGPDLSSSGAKVKWEDVLTPKEEGGLGIKKVTDWNKALMCKHLWKILHPTPPSIWAQWVQTELIGNRSIWQVQVPSNASWSWRKILGLRDLLKSNIRYCIGDGKHTWLWMDPWLSVGAIVEKWGDRLIYDSGLPRHARVDSIIHGRTWRWPVASSHALIELKRIPMPPLSNTTFPDSVIWTPTANGLFTVQSAWDIIRTPKAKVQLHNLVWSSPNIPRASFMSWLALKGKMSTQDRLHRWGSPVLVMWR